MIFFWPLLTPDPAQRLHLLRGDFTNQFYPYHYFAAAEWWSGRIPLWNPYMYGGHPFQADVQTAVFYPLGLLVNLLAGRHGLPFRALEWQGVADYMLAALFTYVFLRIVVRDRLAAVLGAVVFALGGYLTSYPFQQLAVLETSIWLPLILLLVELGMRYPQRRHCWWASAGLSMAVALLGGHPQATLFIAYTAVAYLLFRCWTAGVPWRRVCVGIVLFGAVAVGASAIQLLPTAELIVLSNRARIPYEVAATGYDFVALPGLLLPAWRDEKALYLGVAPLLLVLFALWQRPRRQIWFWGAVSLAALALSFGDRGLLYRLFHAVAPGFAMFKGQERTAFIFSFGGATLAAYGLAALRAKALVRPGRFFALLALGIAVFTTVSVRLFWPQTDLLGGEPDLSRTGYVPFLGLLLVAMGLCWLISRIIRSGINDQRVSRLKGLVSLFLVIVAVADVLLANWHNNLSPVDPAISDSQLAAVGFLKEQAVREGEPIRVRPQKDEALPANYGSLSMLPFASGDSPIVVQRTQDLFTSPEEWRLWQLLNVKYVVGYGAPGEALEEVYAAAPEKVFRNRFSLPRAWVVEEVLAVGTPADAKKAVLSGDFNPGRSAIVESSLPATLVGATSDQAPLQQQITFDYYSPRRIYLHTTTNRDGFLVLSEAYYPGWQARLDDAPVPIYLADYILRGIVLPAGEHRLEMVYNPTTFWLGLAISAATLLFVAALWLSLWRRSRSANSPEHST